MADFITKQEFISGVKKIVDLITGKPDGTRIMKLDQNNGMVSNRITADCGDSLSVCVSMDDFYERFCKTQDICMFTEAAKAVIRSMEEAEGQKENIMDLTDKLFDYGFARNFLRLKLVNTARNQALLAEMPHVPFLDLSAVFYLDLGNVGERKRTIKVNDALHSLWKVPLERMYPDALGNMQKKLPPELRSMHAIMAEMAGLSELSELLEPDKDDGRFPKLYVLSNKEGYMGAASVLCHGVLESCGKKMGGDYYLIPSSIHEFILTVDPECGVDGLKEMIQSVNSEEVDPEEVLSDHAYFYSVKTGILTAV